eukprot:1157479-Pelagomonas_calceolata.AAC.5
MLHQTCGFVGNEKTKQLCNACVIAARGSLQQEPASWERDFCLVLHIFVPRREETTLLTSDGLIWLLLVLAWRSVVASVRPCVCLCKE